MLLFDKFKNQEYMRHFSFTLRFPRDPEWELNLLEGAYFGSVAMVGKKLLFSHHFLQQIIHYFLLMFIADSIADQDSAFLPLWSCIHLDRDL